MRDFTRLEGGYRFVAPWIGGVGTTPYAAGQFTTFALPAYAEAVVLGSPAFALASLEMKWLNGWSAPATFEGEFSAGKGVIRYAW